MAGHGAPTIDISGIGREQPLRLAVIAEVTHDDGGMMRLPALREFATRFQAPLISIEDLAAYLAARETGAAE
ncbi:3,4-dihydroxy-2-butanone-4-phosphate synthase [Arthrobacter sp. 35/47]|uniref:3,4-dihydroxy-2-butanone-4-phosphate synthase n=1 Tax=Arthrobacter sp. 35/47 TaxID=269454 RepID=UPI00047EBB5B|nr:3,4-dihydroxy-2-butanone-4-phosphate synthase [Arthrobacter sp. 35/47]